MKQQPPTTSKITRGFTLLEVLMAMGVFAIGFVFIAAIFPVAALLQKEAVDEVNAQQTQRNVEAIFSALEIDSTEVVSANMSTSFATDVATDKLVHAFSYSWLDNNLKINIRSSPTTITDYKQRKFYWVPVVQTKDSNSYAYIFIMQKRNGAEYPISPTHFTPLDTANPTDVDTEVPKVFAVKVINIDNITKNTLKFSENKFNGDPNTYDTPIQLDVGDQFLDNNGIVYTVSDYNMSDNTISVDGMLLPNPNPITTIWFSSPGLDESGDPSGKSNPAVAILPITLK